MDASSDKFQKSHCRCGAPKNRSKVSAKWFCFHFEFPHSVEHAVEMIQGEARFAKFV